MTDYRKQQLAAAALIDSGDYTAEQIADIYGWIKPKPKPPERSAPEQTPPEQSGTTGHKKTLTAPTKCGIIKSIKRHIRRAKRTKEVHTMTIYGRAITNDDMRNIADYMQDDLREELHGQLAPCSNEEFLREYINRDPDILPLLQSEFDFRL